MKKSKKSGKRIRSGKARRRARAQATAILHPATVRPAWYSQLPIARAMAASSFSWSRDALAAYVKQALPADDARVAVGRIRAKTLAMAASPDDREIFLLIVLPFLVLATAMGFGQTIRFHQEHAGYFDAQPYASMSPREARLFAIAMTSMRPLAESEPVVREVAPQRSAGRRISADANQGMLVSPSSHRTGVMGEGPRVSLGADSAPTALGVVPASESITPARSVRVSVASSQRMEPVFPARAGVGVNPMRSELMLQPLPGELTPVAWTSNSSEVVAALSAGARLPVTFLRTEPLGPQVCTPASRRNYSLAVLPTAHLSTEQFGHRLAAAARRQAREFVIYNDRYKSISYPNGDVSSMFGVCTDVVVRAYRSLGVDLQVLVQKARVGLGDRSIDHRRTSVLAKFFAKWGERLPISRFAEDYRPGDIVTYYRPQNRGARRHIAIVVDRVGPSGRPMIVHNRGWGPQLEDALFVDEITGHYRYRGSVPTVVGGRTNSHQVIRTSAR